MKKSIFKASFEESLNLEDDGFLQYQKKDYYNKLGKAFKKGKPSLQDKIAKGISIYGAGLLGLAVIVNYIFKAFSINFSSSITGFGLFIWWILINIGVIAMIVFMEFPYFLEGYYKWKYPEEYREWEGKTVEEWYGKKYLKKHKELLQNR
ncbi:hypothetical protein HMPREF9422_0188 [Streptococcus cristatus ATCC 51100]|uniref:2TM domain-containing protein n=1 Tax=Streptococcus cristatus ATCC 51100 TaxID=889201 RepID=A0AAV3EFM3_STRCR|nr:hypothetical protein [Streptococcus cristatus]EFX53713.1 hypothetical protein HMPREF9422_0188 [Streptococcus cristatus ATCC 51100]EGU68153.1 hypothetical protein HMPREF9960_1825 [Streptococcus cristatus ATCC 51100]KJQ59754.1 hypothetical protein TZ85_01067 [Streptococcus cristatus]SQG32595.1 Uncharacterised protein [Streptococcus cristatus ATCC 51100]